IARFEQAAEMGARREKREVIVRDGLADGGPAVEGSVEAAVRSHIREDVVLAPQGLVLLQGGAPGLVLRLPPELIEVVRIVNGDGAKNVRVENGEEAGVDAEAEPDCADDGESECGSGADAAPCVADILRERIEPGETPCFAALLQGQRLTAEEPAFAARGAVVALHRAVETDLFGEIGFELPAAQPLTDAVPHSHSTLHDARNAGEEELEAALLFGKLLFSGGGDAVVAGAPVVFRNRPFRRHIVIQQQTLQRGIERAFPHFQRVIRGLLNVLRDAPAVIGAAAERFEHEHFQGSWKKIGVLIGFGHSYRLSIVSTGERSLSSKKKA